MQTISNTQTCTLSQFYDWLTCRNVRVIDSWLLLSLPAGGGSAVWWWPRSVLRGLCVTGMPVSGYSLLPPPFPPTLSRIMDHKTACTLKRPLIIVCNAIPSTVDEPAVMHVISADTTVADTIRYDTPSSDTDPIIVRSLMEKAKIRPIATPKPLNQSSQKLACVITSWTALDMQNFVSIGSGVFVPQIHDFAVHLGWLVFSSFFGGSSIRLQPTPLNGFLRKVRRNTSFRVRKCLLGVSIIENGQLLDRYRIGTITGCIVSNRMGFCCIGRYYVHHCRFINCWRIALHTMIKGRSSDPRVTRPPRTHACCSMVHDTGEGWMEGSGRRL